MLKTTLNPCFDTISFLATDANMQNEFENAICRMTAIMHQLQCGKETLPYITVTEHY